MRKRVQPSRSVNGAMMHELKKDLNTLFKRCLHCTDACVISTFDSMFALVGLISPLFGEIRIFVLDSAFQISCGL